MTAARGAAVVVFLAGGTAALDDAAEEARSLFLFHIEEFGHPVPDDVPVGEVAADHLINHGPVRKPAQIPVVYEHPYRVHCQGNLPFHPASSETGAHTDRLSFLTHAQHDFQFPVL